MFLKLERVSEEERQRDEVHREQVRKMEEEREQERHELGAIREAAMADKAEAVAREKERTLEREREREERQVEREEDLTLAATWLRRQQDARVESVVLRRRASLLRCGFRAVVWFSTARRRVRAAGQKMLSRASFCLTISALFLWRENTNALRRIRRVLASCQGKARSCALGLSIACWREVCAVNQSVRAEQERESERQECKRGREEREEEREGGERRSDGDREEAVLRKEREQREAWTRDMAEVEKERSAAVRERDEVRVTEGQRERAREEERKGQMVRVKRCVNEVVEGMAEVQELRGEMERLKHTVSDKLREGIQRALVRKDADTVAAERAAAEERDRAQVLAELEFLERQHQESKRQHAQEEEAWTEERQRAIDAQQDLQERLIVAEAALDQLRQDGLEKSREDWEAVGLPVTSRVKRFMTNRKDVH